MTRQEKIDELQDKAQHYRISKEELGKDCVDELKEKGREA